MNADMGFAQHDHPRHARAFAEMMEMGAQDLRACRERRGRHLALERHGVHQEVCLHAAKVGQHMAAGCSVHGHLWDPPDDQPDPPE
ncbi:hypothetical protein D3C72_2139720 [compost metagenome]